MLSEEILRQFLPFGDFSDVFLAEAMAMIHITKAKKGTIIFKRGKELADKFFLMEGEVHLIDNQYGSERVCGSDARAQTELNDGSPSKVSAIAKTPVTYFTINTADLDNLTQGRLTPVAMIDDIQLEEGGEIEVAELGDEQDWMSCLLKSPLFGRIQSSRLQELFARFETIDVAAGETIFKEGAKGDYFYVLASGLARIRDRSGAIDVMVNEGRYFGEESLLSRAPRNASVTMVSDGVIKRLSADDFASLVRDPVLQYLAPNALDQMSRPYKLLDVRLPIEYRVGHVPGSINVPLSRLRTQIAELAQNNAYVVSDEGDGRADIAAYLLCQAGLDAFVLKNGTN